jgi:FMN phosphatase YigB (HAD superfamily)
MYVGDNAEKDFQAPRQLGMRSLWFRNKDGLYQSEANDVRMTGNINEYFNINKLC